MKRENIRLEIMQQRIDHGMSQSDLAKKVGVSQRSISMWENGEAIPRNTTCIKLANALGLPRDYFLLNDSDAESSEDADEKAMKEVNEAIDKLIEHYGDIESAVTHIKKMHYER